MLQLQRINHGRKSYHHTKESHAKDIEIDKDMLQQD